MDEKIWGLCRTAPILLLLVNISCSYASPVTPSVGDEKQSIVQLSLNAKDLNSYFHIDVFPDRVPLIVVKNKYVVGLKLRKFKHDVVFMDRKTIKVGKKPYLELTNFKIEKNTASVDILYPPEGIYAQLKFVKFRYEWTLVDSKIVEWQIKSTRSSSCK